MKHGTGTILSEHDFIGKNINYDTTLASQHPSLHSFRTREKSKELTHLIFKT